MLNVQKNHFKLSTSFRQIFYEALILREYISQYDDDNNNDNNDIDNDFLAYIRQ